ncbi:MAG: FAD-dependent oxidoreductase, partial [Alistipes sp.]|nr:FAD-dependent oxidoreductase [Alistipes sp.]
IEVTGLEKKKCVTRHLHIHGYLKKVDRSRFRYVYGSDADKIAALEQQNPDLARKLHPRLDNTAAEVIWAVRHEMAQTVEDVLARRFRALFLDARASIDMAPEVAKIMAGEMGHDQNWIDRQLESYNKDAEGYLLVDYVSKQKRERNETFSE